MKKIIIFFCSLFSLGLAAMAKSSVEVKIISYNIRTLARDGENSWQYRKHATENMLLKHNPDAFGLQEATVTHLLYIDSVCPQYARVGVGRDDGKMGGEIMAIYYKKERFDLLDSGTFWLSETPNLVSRGWDAACFRTVTWVKLQDKATKKSFFYFNTHFDHKGKVAQKESVELIIEIIKGIAGKRTPVILSGDFNVELDNDIFKPLLNFMRLSRADALVTDNKGTFNGFGSVKRNVIIDHIFYKGRKIKCSEYRTLDGDYGAKYISDHYPLEVIFKMK